MRILLSTFFFVLLPLFSFSQNFKLDQANGFNDFKFGLSPEHFKGLSLEIDEGNTKLYSIEKPLLSNKDLKVDDIHLTFLNNKLCTISLQTKGIYTEKMFQFLKENYGAPKTNFKNNTCEWKGALIDVTFNSNKNVAVIDFYYKK